MSHCSIPASHTYSTGMLSSGLSSTGGSFAVLRVSCDGDPGLSELCRGSSSALPPCALHPRRPSSVFLRSLRPPAGGSSTPSSSRSALCSGMGTCCEPRGCITLPSPWVPHSLHRGQIAASGRGQCPCCLNTAARSSPCPAAPGSRSRRRRNLGLGGQPASGWWQRDGAGTGDTGRRWPCGTALVLTLLISVMANTSSSVSAPLRCSRMAIRLDHGHVPGTSKVCR